MKRAEIPEFSPEEIAELPHLAQRDDYQDAAALTPLELAQKRQAEGYQVGVDDDGRRLAYVIRGGGMKAVANAGASEELHNSRLTPDGPSLLQVPDVIVGDSAGAIIAAADIAGQADLTPRVFVQNLPYQHFINPFRRRIVDLDILRENLESSFDVDALFESPTELCFSVANLNTMETEVYSTKDGTATKDNIMDKLFDGMHLPILAGESSDHMGDGGLLQLCTEKLAVEAGATDILSLSNSPESTGEEGEMSWFLVRAIGLWIQKNGRAPRLNGIREYRQFVKEQAAFLPKLACGEYAEEMGVNMDIIYPEAVEDMPGMMERDQQKLMVGYVAGRNAVRRELELPQIIYQPQGKTRSPLTAFAKQLEAYKPVTKPVINPGLAS